MENSLHGDLASMVLVSVAMLLAALVFALAGRGAIAIWRSRSSVTTDNGASTGTAERLAAMIEGDDIEDMTIEERILGLATGLKNVKHRVSMFEGKLNKLSPPAGKTQAGNGADVVVPERPRTRSDVFKEWRMKNAR